MSEVSLPLAGRALLVTLAAGVCCLAAAQASASGRGEEVRVTTDGHLRVGHLEAMQVGGLPGKGLLQVSFFPTAICEGECGARSFLVGHSNADGAAKFRVRVPGTFFDHRGRHAYFRNGEFIDVELTWEGPDHSFDAGSAEPEPILVRSHGGHGG